MNGFETGDLSGWSSSTTDGGDLSVSTAAAATGAYGLQAVIDDLNAKEVTDSTPNSEKHYSARFYFNPNSVSIPNDNSFDIMDGNDTANGGSWVFRLILNYKGGFYSLGTEVKNDAGNFVSSDKATYITGDWQAIEIEWKASSAPGANDGYMKLWINDVLVDEFTGVDNDTRSLTDIYLGAVSGLDAGTAGTIYFDDFESRTGSHIGLDPNGPTLQPPLTDLAFVDGFESGDFSSWDQVNTNNGNLSVSTAAAAAGSYGLQATANGTHAMNVAASTTTNEKRYRTRFYFNPNNLTLVDGDRVGIFGATSGSIAFRLFLEYSGGSYWISQEYQTDSNTYVGGEHYYITDDWQAIEFDWQAASSAGANDGHLSMWINDTLVETLDGIDNDTHSVTAASVGLLYSLDPGMAGTLYFNSFVSSYSEYIGLDPNGPALSSPSGPPDLAFSDGFESGDFSKWTDTALDGGDLAVTTDAAHQSSYGLKALIDDTASIIAYYDSPVLEDSYNLRFYFNPNSLSLANGKAHYIYDGVDASNGAKNVRLELLRENNAYKLRVTARRDDGTSISSAKYAISNDWHEVEVDWQAASSDGANDGSTGLWIDDTQMETLSGLDNDTLPITELRLGAVSGVDSGTAGAMLFDDIVVHRDTHVGPLASQARFAALDRGLNVLAAFSTEPKVNPTTASVSMWEATNTGALTPTPVRTPNPLPRPDLAWAPGASKAEANFVLARYSQPSILHVGLSSLHQETVSQTIDYTYDPLGRLTAADYSTGDYYYYAYDAVGNRLTQETQAGATSYTYDIANRLTQAGNNTYTWDNNGNLLGNGTDTYSYDPANRLTAISGGQAAIGFGYDGLGDRLQQTLDNQTTDYSLDINTNLPVVLNDDSNSYIYGLGNIAQSSPENTSYFLGDALGSTRQLSDTTGDVTFSQNYDPFGDSIGSTGDASSIYGYAGEQTDSTGLQYLRARYYDPGTGRFLSHDSFPGYINLPQSQNPFAYSMNNPVFYVDPSGKLAMPWNNHNPSSGGPLGIGNNFSNGWVDKAIGAVDHAFGGAENIINGNCINWGQLLMDGGAQAIAFMVGVPAMISDSYMQGWTNFNSATAILKNLSNPNVPTIYKAYAVLYAFIWGAANAGLAIGSAVLLWEGAAALGEAAYPVVLKACLLSAICATMIGAGGGALVLGKMFEGASTIADDSYVAIHPAVDDISIAYNGLDPLKAGSDNVFATQWQYIKDLTLEQANQALKISGGVEKWTDQPVTLWQVWDNTENLAPYFGEGLGDIPQWISPFPLPVLQHPELP